MFLYVRYLLLQCNQYLAGRKTLKTCSLRPAGIYGEGELRHLPRIVVCCAKMAFQSNTVFNQRTL